MADLGIGAASLGIAVVALAAAVMQITMQVDIDARRKGKTDRLALGDWAIDWPQAKLFLYFTLHLFRLKSPWGDPRILTVPFITVGEIEKYLSAEAASLNRGDLRRRIEDRLVESATKSMYTGGDRYSGRMYAVRATTRKSCEACWSDAMHMCGMTRKYWSLLTGVSAQACDGAIRPANAVTNLHSLWGFGRIMGLREVVRSGSRITMTNGGASLYLDLYAGVDRPTRLAHFSGSPNGRYMIIEEMSQHTSESVYADAVWASGYIPNPDRLTPGHKPLPTGKQTPAQTRLGLPREFPTASFHVSSEDVDWNSKHDDWAQQFVNILGSSQDSTSSSTMTLVQYVYSPAVVVCIRTYPVGNLADDQLHTCYHALRWCTQNWELCQYQKFCRGLQSRRVDRPSIPMIGIGYIGPEFVTGIEQAQDWYSRVYDAAGHGGYAPVDGHYWSLIKAYSEIKAQNPFDGSITLNAWAYIIVVKVLQLWKLELFNDLHRSKSAPFQTSPGVEKFNSLGAMLATVTMASIVVATDSTIIGDDEVNKAMEIELGAIL